MSPKRLPLGDLRPLVRKRRLTMKKSRLSEFENTPLKVVVRLEKAYLKTLFSGYPWLGRAMIKHFREGPILPWEPWNSKILQEGLSGMRRYLIKSKQAKSRAVADKVIKVKIAELNKKIKSLNESAARQRFSGKIEQAELIGISKASHFLLNCNHLVSRFARDLLSYMKQKGY